MPRKRTPIEKAKVTGQADRRPGRYGSRREPRSAPLGSAPAWMNAGQRKAWDSLKASWFYLTEKDRHHVMIGAVILAEIVEKHGDVSVSKLNQFRMICAACGGNPADGSKVNFPDEQDNDPAAKYIN